MSACVVEEGRDEGGGSPEVTPREHERTRREVLLSGRGRRACSEQGPHPGLNFRKYYILSRLYVMSNHCKIWNVKKNIINYIMLKKQSKQKLSFM